MNDMIFTPRLELRPGSMAAFTTAPHDREALAVILGVNVPESWPVDHYDDDPLTWCRNHLERDPECAPWLMRYMILRETNTLIGTVGCAPVDDSAAVTVGYAVLPEYRRRGYASEALAALIEWAFRWPHVERAVAYTYPDLVASIGVLAKNGFVLTGDGLEPGTIRYERAKCYTPPAP